MSGFDFDALRDPDAPVPGVQERAGVDARARALRVRARRGRLALSSVSVVAVVALVLGVVAATRPTGPRISVGGSGTTPAASVGDRFIPPTTTENGIVTLPVTLPDGETLTIRYPEALRIAQLGFAGGIGVSGTEVLIHYTTIQRVYGDAKPLATYRGASGESVLLFRGSQAVGYVGDKLDYLVFQFGPWLVQAADAGMTEAQRATWARSLTGTTDAHGYLVLRAQAPLRVNNEFDGGFGPFVVGENEVELSSHLYCGQPESDSGAHRRFVNGDGSKGVSWCAGDLHVSATGSRAFADLADRNLQVTPLSSPTTTTPAVTSNFKAFSASFVSPQHGWALTNGPVEETTDGGRTWGRVGSMGGRFHGRIRFADATHGFAFTDSQLMATTDGGKYWSLVAAPFSSVYDLAVARGAVYVVSFDTSAQPAFRIWSSPVGDTLHWTEDPLVIPPGAGPVPTIQLVFSGDRGWLVQVDRVVVSGARMASDGAWTAWTPPCATANGSAWLSASSSTELVASCLEHTYGGGPIQSSISFSHDGGQTFRRHAAPESGLIATPNSTTAIVTGSAGVERSTDEGSTWLGVFDVGIGAVDLGFTTSTQGFVVLTNGEMLMTYDAGATWQKVTLP